MPPLRLMTFVSLYLAWLLFVPAFCFAHVVNGSELHLPPEDPGEIHIIEGNWDAPAPIPASNPPTKRAQKERPKKETIPSTQAVKVPVLAAEAATASDERVVKGPSSFKIFKHYVSQGFLHILPLGADHILFILGLFFLSTQLRPLVLQVSLFSLAHTLTLVISSLKIVNISPSIIEPIIAASIVFVAVENILKSSLNKFRVFLVFVFGLLHGLGFASALTEVGLPTSQFATALAGFSVGVELGQLSVVGLAFILVAPFRQKLWYHRRVVVPVCAAISLIALYWTVTRVF
jgi:hypothetical protein